MAISKTQIATNQIMDESDFWFDQPEAGLCRFLAMVHNPVGR